MGGGDQNDWCVVRILQAELRLQNLQQLLTLDGKNLDVFLSNLGPFYSNPDTKPGKAYSTLKWLGSQPGDSVVAGGFQIPEHTRMGLTAAQSAERITLKFVQISQE